jgi:hypothetical protein
MKSILYFLFGILLSTTLFSQNNYLDSENRFRAYTKFGIEPTTVFILGMEYKSNIELFNSPIGFYGQTTLLFFNPGFKNAEFKIGASYYINLKGSFGIIDRLNASTGSVSTANFNSRKYAVANEFELGFYKSRWYVSILTIEYEKILATRIEHTEHYREVFYGDARDGWYKSAGGRWQFGLEYGRTLKQKVDIHIELKVPFTGNFKAYAGAPYHLILGVGYRF